MADGVEARLCRAIVFLVDSGAVDVFLCQRAVLIVFSFTKFSNHSLNIHKIEGTIRRPLLCKHETCRTPWIYRNFYL